MWKNPEISGCVQSKIKLYQEQIFGLTSLPNSVSPNVNGMFLSFEYKTLTLLSKYLLHMVTC